MKTIPLSPVDYVFTGTGSQPITFAFSYRTRLDPVHLQTGLRATLDQFPVLRSRLQKVNEQEMVFLEDDGGPSFSIRETDKIFSKNNRIEDYISPVQSVEYQPLTGITLTHTPDGSVLAVSISHALVDGFSYFHFLSGWARISRGDRIIPPHIPRDMFSEIVRPVTEEITDNSLYKECGLFVGDKRTVHDNRDTAAERVFFRREMIKRYIQEAVQSYSVSVSENDVVTALLWKKYIPLWSGVNDDHNVYITCPFDFRRVLTGFPKNYFGCALCFATTETTRDHLAGASIPEIAILIRKTVAGIKDDYLRRSLSVLEAFRNRNGFGSMGRIHLRHPQNGMIVTNISRLPVRDLDFGAGVPDDFLAYAEIDRSAAILPGENGVEAYIAHPRPG